MSIGRGTRLFFDASCLFAAADSPTGGSAFLVSVCARGFLQAVVSAAVLEEAARNIAAERPAAILTSLHELVRATPFALVTAPSEAEVLRQRPVFQSDDHVVAAALAAGIDFLITLDQ